MRRVRRDRSTARAASVRVVAGCAAAALLLTGCGGGGTPDATTGTSSIAGFDAQAVAQVGFQDPEAITTQDHGITVTSARGLSPLSLIHISEPTRLIIRSRMPSSA